MTNPQYAYSFAIGDMVRFANDEVSSFTGRLVTNVRALLTDKRKYILQYQVDGDVNWHNRDDLMLKHRARQDDVAEAARTLAIQVDVDNDNDLVSDLSDQTPDYQERTLIAFRVQFKRYEQIDGRLVDDPQLVLVDTIIYAYSAKQMHETVAELYTYTYSNGFKGPPCYLEVLSQKPVVRE